MWIRKTSQQAQLDGHDQRIRNERVRILVEGFAAGEDQDVARQVQKHVDEQQQAGDADEKLRADGGRKVALKPGE